MQDAVVAMFDAYDAAQRARDALLTAGFAQSDVHLSPSDDSDAARHAALGTAEPGEEHASHWTIGGFFRSLFGSDADDADVHPDAHHGAYAEAMRRGSFMVSVDATGEDAQERASAILLNCDPIDIESRAQQWRSEGWSGYDSSQPLYSRDAMDEERQRYAGASASSAGLAGADPTLMPNTGSAMDIDGLARQGDATSAASFTGQAPESMDTMDSGVNRGSVSGGARTAGTTGTGAGMQEGEQRLPVVEESLQVGKREVSRGGVRVFRRVSERPVEETVHLRDEHVRVERHPVDRPAQEIGAEAFREQTVELHETAEEPVVAKTARVVEEVVVGKEARERDETVRDTVRRTDVEVQPLGANDAGSGSAAMAAEGSGRGLGSGLDSGLGSGGLGSGGLEGASTGDDAWRTHWQQSYANAGGRYEDYAPAYQYGSRLADDERYRGQAWNDIEPQVRSDWESRNAGPWERTRDAVRYGWEKLTH